MKNKLNNFYIGEVRDGQNRYKVDEKISLMEKDCDLIVYKDDVTTYYYSVPRSLLTTVKDNLLEIFYADNYDYGEEHLKDFKENYPSIFKTKEA